MDLPEDPLLEFAASERVSAPTAPRSAPMGRETAVIAVAGVGVGAAIAGPIGAAVGGAVGLAADAVRRRLLKR